jgi:hypothetical protein
MKFKCPDHITGNPMIDGKVYTADRNRVIEIPDDKVHDGIFGRGFARVPDDAPVAKQAADKPVKTETQDKGN